jgi:hypothetical protein
MAGAPSSWHAVRDLRERAGAAARRAGRRGQRHRRLPNHNRTGLAELAGQVMVGPLG